MLYLIKCSPIYLIGDIGNVDLYRLAFPKLIGWNYASPSDDNPIIRWYTFPTDKGILLE